MAVRRPSKALIEPALEFTIPSLHDSLQLDARIYNAAPRDPEAAGGLASGREGHVRGAIIAHPYAPTGGSQDDRVVMGIVETLVGSGWVVGTFNFRGVKGSRGSTSWTSKSEVSDYKSMLGLMTGYLNSVAASRGELASEIEMILGGYSYGSLIVSQLGDIKEIMHSFEDAVVPSPAAEINAIAADLAKRSLGVVLNRLPSYNTVMNGGCKTAQVGVSAVAPHRPPVRPAYLLVSPLLPPISGMLQLSVPRPLKSLFRRSSASADDEPHNMDSAVFTHNPTLAVFGAEEEFTSARKLSAWGEKMVAASPMRTDYVPRQGSVLRSGSIVEFPVAPPAPTVVPHMFEWDEIEDAGHFWREPSVDGILKGRIRDWAGTL